MTFGADDDEYYCHYEFEKSECRVMVVRPSDVKDDRAASRDIDMDGRREDEYRGRRRWHADPLDG